MSAAGTPRRSSDSIAIRPRCPVAPGDDDVPPRVDYALTPLGFSLLGLVKALEDWAETHIEDVLDARTAYDQAQA